MFLNSAISNSKNILDYANTKNNVIANNISNISNPNYKRQYMNDFSFSNENSFDSMLKKTRVGHISDNSSLSGYEIHTENSTGKNDGNNVNMDKEIIDLSSNQYLYQLSSTVLQKEYSKLLEAIF